MPKPWTRIPTDFKIQNIRKWSQNKRDQLVWALLVFVNNWKAAGRPEPKKIGCHLGSFEHYECIIGGILEVNAIDGFLDNLNEFYQLADEEGYILEEFVNAWNKRYGQKEVFCNDLLSLVEDYGIGLPVGDGSMRSKLTRLGKILEHAIDRHIGSFIIRKKPGKISGKNVYVLESSIRLIGDKGDNQVDIFGDVKK
jgi:hypothetical protein